MTKDENIPIYFTVTSSSKKVDAVVAIGLGVVVAAVTYGWKNYTQTNSFSQINKSVFRNWPKGD